MKHQMAGGRAEYCYAKVHAQSHFGHMRSHFGPCFLCTQVGTWHSTYADGVEVFHFPSGQTEAHHPGGLKEVLFPDGAARRVLPDGWVVYVYNYTYTDIYVYTVYALCSIGCCRTGGCLVYGIRFGSDEVCVKVRKIYIMYRIQLLYIYCRTGGWVVCVMRVVVGSGLAQMRCVREFAYMCAHTHTHTQTDTHTHPAVSSRMQGGAGRAPPAAVISGAAAAAPRAARDGAGLGTNR